LDNKIIAIALTCLILITTIVVIQFIQPQLVISRIQKFMDETPTSVPQYQGEPMSNKAYWDCKGDPRKTFEECEALRK